MPSAIKKQCTGLKNRLYKNKNMRWFRISGWSVIGTLAVFAAAFTFSPVNINETLIAPLQAPILSVPEDSDMAIVLGAGLKSDGMLTDVARERVEHAIKLHKSVGLPLIFSGGPTQFGTEAEAMQEYAAANGYQGPEFIEKKSTSTYQNAFFSDQLIDSQNLKADKVVIITSSYHSGRALKTFRNNMPEREVFISYPEDSVVLNNSPRARWSGLYSLLRERLANFWYFKILKL